MPFTPAHVAAVVPLRNKRTLVWSALVIGSIAPDFEYFLDLGPGHRIGHSFPGVFLFTLPAAVFVLWLFHTIMKQPLTELMPAPLEMRLMPQVTPFRFGGIRRFGQILISIVIGVATHLLWDSFTHGGTWVTVHVPWLRTRFVLPWYGPMAMFNALQLGSSVFGLVVVGYVCWRWYRKTQPVAGRASRLSPANKLLLWLSMSTLATAGALGRVFMLVGDPKTPSLQVNFVVLLVVIFIALIFWQIVLYGVFVVRPKESSGD